MDCIKVLKQLNRRKLEGFTYLIINELSIEDLQELEFCGFFIKKLENGYQIHE